MTDFHSLGGGAIFRCPQICVLIQLSAIWGAKNPSKNEVRRENDCGAVRPPEVMIFTVQSHTMTFSRYVYLDLRKKISRYSLVQFGTVSNRWYSFEWLFPIFFREVSEKIKI